MDSSGLIDSDKHNEGFINEHLQLFHYESSNPISEEEYLFVNCIQDDFHGFKGIERHGEYYLTVQGYFLSETYFNEYINGKKGELSLLAKEYVYPMSIDHVLLNSLSSSVSIVLQSQK